VVTASALTRRRLLRNGAAGTAAVYLASQWEILDSAAIGAPLAPALRRSTWTALAGTTVRAAGQRLTVVEVTDLPIAATIPALQGHDGAFVVHFSGDRGLAAGTVAVTGDRDLATELFLSPVDATAGSSQHYEAIIDRTIRIAGVNEEGSPAPVDPTAVRVAQTAGPALRGAPPPSSISRAPATSSPCAPAC
jgi:hypothetical protein